MRVMNRFEVFASEGYRARCLAQLLYWVLYKVDLIVGAEILSRLCMLLPSPIQASSGESPKYGANSAGGSNHF